MNKTIFTPNRARKQMKVVRSFQAPLPLVWKAWTEPELLDQWWGPAPWQAKTSFMDFRPGGHWLYSMNGPEGEQHWSRTDYERISPRQGFSATDTFVDAQGNKLEGMPGMHWDVSFHATGNATRVEVLISFPSLADMDQTVAMGFKEGFTLCHDQLEQLLPQLSKTIKP